MKVDELVNKLVEKSSVTPIYVSEVVKLFPYGSDEYAKIISELDERDIEVIDDTIDLEDDFKYSDNDIDESKIDLSNLPFKGDIVELYLRDISAYPVLSQEEEAELFELIEKGNEAEEKLGLDATEQVILSFEEKEYYYKLSQEAEQAKSKIINCNLRLVVHNAKNYNNRGLSFMDLIQEGSMGLLVAVNKFDYKRGYKFSTYATNWIRQAISRALDISSRTIRIPSHIIEKNNKINDARRKLSVELGRDPSDEEIAKAVSMPVDKIKNIQQVFIKPASLESKVGNDDDSTLGEFVKDTNGLDPYEYTKKHNLKETLISCFKSLNEREINVLILRYGLGDEKPLTLDEVGKRFDLTKERIRQIESRALKKLREPKNLELLKDFKNNE